VPSCAEGGVLGVLPGVIGSLQALEAIKLIVGAGQSLLGRLLTFDALKLRFREIAVAKDPDCPVCGTHPTVKALIDYEAFCGYGETGDGKRETEISAQALRAERERNPALVLLDVREPFERDIAVIPDARAIPLGELPARLRELDGRATIVAYCHHGMRSLRAVEILAGAGFANVRSLRGGIDGWSVEVDPGLPRY
jgi:adenylyltransferase/sulfurtransferase